jgi:hypothetical protein
MNMSEPRVQLNRMRRITATLLCVVFAGSMGTAAPRAGAASAQLGETVRITVPPVVEFNAGDVAVTTNSSTGVTSISFDLAVLGAGRALRISVKGDGDLIPPTGSSIPASNVTWRASNATAGVGVNGVLSRTTYTAVFQGNPLATSGRVELLWTLSAPGKRIRAGTHQLPLRWRVESVIP